MIKSIIDKITASCPNIASVTEALSGNDYPENISEAAAFVGLIGENSKPSEHANRVVQEIQTKVLVQLACPKDQIYIVTRELRQALIGVTPTKMMYPLEFVEGSILDIKPRVIWWSEVYQTGYIHKQT